MSELYRASLLLSAGTCVALAMQLGALAWRSRNHEYIRMLVLALLAAAFSFATHRCVSSERAQDAQFWGQALCLLTPYLLYLFGQLCLGLLTPPRWILQIQGANLFLSTLFAGLALADILLGSSFVLEPWQLTSLEHIPRLPVHATPLGNVQLGYSALAAAICLGLAVGATRRDRDLLPIVQ